MRDSNPVILDTRDGNSRVRAAPRAGIRRGPLSSARRAPQWMGMLIASICLEGLGRKYLPFVPATAFYFLKDAVLLGGLLFFGIQPRIASLFVRLFSPFSALLGLAFIWTVIEVFNPEQTSVALGFIGLRSYWLWFLAPLVIASAVETPDQRRQVVLVLAGVAVIVALMAAYQFTQPADSGVNSYALYEGKEVLEVATVQTTGRARVSSTFSYLTGFTGFVVLVPVLLVSSPSRESGKRRKRA